MGTRTIAVIMLLFFLAGSANADGLADKVDGIIKRNGLENANFSFLVMTMDGKEIIYQKNPTLLLNPASDTKIVTAAAALRTLGPQFTFKTKFLSERKIRDGKIQNLWIVGQGDPYLVSEELERIVSTLKSEGLKMIEGDIIVDDSYFESNTGTTYISNENGKVYQVFTNALSLNFNSIRIVAKGGDEIGAPVELNVDPETRAYVNIFNEATTSRRGNTLKAKFEPMGESIGVTISGTLAKKGRWTIHKGVPNPSLYMGNAFLQHLTKSSIGFKGKIREGSAKDSLTPLAIYYSRPLSKALRGLGKKSNNFMAEQILIAMGAIKKGPPGSTKKGAEVIRDYLSSIDIPAGSYAVESGSGLSKANRLSAAQIMRVMFEVYNNLTYREPFLTSLSIAGIDGTMEKKFLKSGVKGKVFAKTGRLNESNCLSGFLKVDEKLIGFSFLANNFKEHHEKVEKAYEEILEAVDESVSR